MRAEIRICYWIETNSYRSYPKNSVSQTCTFLGECHGMDSTEKSDGAQNACAGVRNIFHRAAEKENITWDRFLKMAKK